MPYRSRRTKRSRRTSKVFYIPQSITEVPSEKTVALSTDYLYQRAYGGNASWDACAITQDANTRNANYPLTTAIPDWAIYAGTYRRYVVVSSRCRLAFWRERKARWYTDPLAAEEMHPQVTSMGPPLQMFEGAPEMQLPWQFWLHRDLDGMNMVTSSFQAAQMQDYVHATCMPDEDVAFVELTYNIHRQPKVVDIYDNDEELGGYTNVAYGALAPPELWSFKWGSSTPICYTAGDAPINHFSLHVKMDYVIKFYEPVDNDLS